MRIIAIHRYGDRYLNHEHVNIKIAVFTTTNLGRPVKITAPMKTHHESLRARATPSFLQRTWWGMGPNTPEACSHPKLTNNSWGCCNSSWAGPVPIWAGLKETALYFRCLRKFLLCHRHWQLAPGYCSARKEDFLRHTFSVFIIQIRHCTGVNRR